MLPEHLSIRDDRLAVHYTHARLMALEETRSLAAELAEAGDHLTALQAEEAQLDLTRVESQAMVEIADDSWDDAVLRFERRLLELAGHSHDHPLYRKYFAEIPSHLTSLSYYAEIMISKELEVLLFEEEREELRVFATELASCRTPLEAALRERVRLEVTVAKFQNRCQLAHELVTRLMRQTKSALEELSTQRDREPSWLERFFLRENDLIDSIDFDGVDNIPSNNGVSVEGNDHRAAL